MGDPPIETITGLMPVVGLPARPADGPQRGDHHGKKQKRQRDFHGAA